MKPQGQTNATEDPLTVKVPCVSAGSTQIKLCREDTYCSSWRHKEQVSIQQLNVHFKNLERGQGDGSGDKIL